MKTFFQPFDPRQEMRRPDFEIFHNKDMHLDSVGLHHHDFYEVYFFLGGKAEYRVEGRLYRLRPGDVLLLSPMELHQVTVQAGRVPYERIVLWISRPYLAFLGNGEAPLSRCFDNALSEHTNLLKRSDGVQIQPLFEHLLEERRQTLYAGEACARGYLLQLLVQLNRLAMNSRQPAGENSPLVSRAVAYINHHYAEEITLDDLASQLHVSKYYLCHEFSRVAGTSVYRFLTLKRLQIARELLLQGTAPGEAAAQCGFKDYPNFYRAFKTRYRLSPRDCVLRSGEF